MLSIVKMDMDSDSESMDEEIHIKEEIIVKKEPFYIGESEEIMAESGLDLVPLVYTTRLDNMAVLNSNTNNMHPREVTAKILKESKPSLGLFPNNNYSLRNKKSFYAVKTKLKKIYQRKSEKGDVRLDFPVPLIEPNSIKKELHEDAIDASISTEVETDALVKCEVFDEPIIRACKYSELLKLCRPCSVVLPKLYGHEVTEKYSALRNKPVIPVTSKLTIRKHIIKKEQYQNVEVTSVASSSDEEPLITLEPNLNPQLVTHDSGPVCGVTTKKRKEKLCEPLNCQALDENCQKAFLASFRNRIVSYSVLKVTDLYSDEYSLYCTDDKGFLSEYYKEMNENVYDCKKYVSVCSSNFFPIKTCCWVHRDAIIQSLYPKVLLYSCAQFMRKPHTCPPAACSCCCQKPRESYEKPDMSFHIGFSEFPTPVLQEDIEIAALDKEIQISIDKMRKETRRDPSNILHNLLNNPSTLIGKALMYKKPLPKKPKENRRLESIKLDNSQASVIVLRNFAADEREIYELSPDGELKSYFKLTCFNNTDPPDVKKLLQKTKKVSGVCCWFRREKLITELMESKTLRPSSVMFIRTRHTCAGNECGCCCKPAEAKGVTLTDITFPSRPSYWPEIVSKIVKATPKPAGWLDNYILRPARSCTPSPPPTSATTPIPIAPKPLPKKKPITNKHNALKTRALPLNHQHISPSASVAGNSSSKPITNDDCLFVDVRSSPIFGLEPHPLNPIKAKIDQPMPKNATNVQVAEVSEEVNTLITSILDRFKDVRLTINSDGKVAAALNTPVSNLSTVELKVLANILSYAQSQVNSLGLNSSMSVSNIINLRVSDPQLPTSVDPGSVFKAFGDNINQSQAANVDKSFNTVTANMVPNPNNFPTLPNAPNTNDMAQYFTKSQYERNKEYTDSFTSLLSTKLDAESSDIGVPVIQNVFSLKEVTKIENETSSTTVFCRTPGNQNQILKAPTTTMNTNKVYENSMKRTPANMEVAPPETKKMRVVPPSKLIGTPVEIPNAMVNAVYQPLPTPTMHNRALEVNGLVPGIHLLSNNNFRVVSVTPQVPQPQVTKPRIIRMNNFKAFSNSSLSQAQPSIVVAPLQFTGGNVVQNLPMIRTPFSETSVGTSSQTEEIKILEVPIKIEQDCYEDDDCILGM